MVQTFERTSPDSCRGAWTEETGAFTVREVLTVPGRGVCADVALLHDGTVRTWTFTDGLTERDEWPATALVMGFH